MKSNELLCMEMSGVEPLSENIATNASTSVVSHLSFRLILRRQTRYESAIPYYFCLSTHGNK